jgi:isopropylmalate/homocitrate/citramalate synthase
LKDKRKMKNVKPNNEPWVHKMWSVSPYNFSKKESAKVPKKVEIHETTLRDGISDPARGIIVNTDQKVKIAQILDDFGVQRIEGGSTNPDSNFEDLKALAQAGLRAPVYAMTPTASFTWKEWEAVDLALKADISGIVLNFPASEHLIKHYYPGWTKEKVLEKAISMACYAKKHGLLVSFFEYDTTRAEPAFLKKLLKAAVEQAKVDSVSIVDTLGVGSPVAVAHLVEQIRSWVEAPIELHMHDDFGLAYANTLAGVEAGGQIVHATINGIGKMPATEDLVTSLRILYGVDVGVKYGKTFEVCRSIREIGNWTISPFRPITGELAFGYDSDVRIDENRSQKAPFLPEFIGHNYEIVISGRTGPEGVKLRLKKAGKKATEKQVDQILQLVKEKWKKIRRALADDEFEAIVQKVI